MAACRTRPAAIQRSCPHGHSARCRLDGCGDSRFRSLLPAVLLALNTGMRYSELRLLRWNQVDLTRKTVRSARARLMRADRGISPMGAATLGGLHSIMQLPGRALLVRGMPGSPAALVLISLSLQATGLAAFALAPSVIAVAAAIALFAAGAGLTTLARPHFVQTVFSIDSAGYANGQLARAQQLARAAGLSARAGWGKSSDTESCFFVLGTVMAVLALTSQNVLNRMRGHHDERSEATVTSQ